MKYELINYCEFDKYATKAYSLIHNEPESKNLGDITLVNEKEIADFNMMVGGSPCQDFSIAGNQEGVAWLCNDCGYKYNPLEAHYSARDKCPNCSSINIEKTRSSLLVEWLRVLREKKPNLAIYENVKNIVSKKFRPTFDLFENELREYGYNTYWKVLNAKDYGIPQNRERVYLIIIKKELDNGKFKFPKGFDNGIRLKDVLEKEVDEKYYISQEKTDKLIEQLKNKEISNTVRSSGRGSVGRHSWDMVCVEDNKIMQVGMLDIKGNEQIRRVYDPDGLSPTLNSMQGGNRQPKMLENNLEKTNICKELFNINPSNQGISGRVYDSNFISPTLDTTIKKCLDINYRVRKLTPLECFRLMGFSDKDYYILENNKISNSQCYKMAGNSIVVDVIYYILLEIYKAMPYLLEDIKLGSFFSGIGAFEKAILRLQKNINMQRKI